MSAFFLEHPKETDLALFAGGESGPFARWRIERHVERCAECQEAAAEYFRLPDQLAELGELPDVDWNQLAMSIETGVRADATAQRSAARGFLPPLAWKAGLVAATALVAVTVVRQGVEPQEPAVEMMAALEEPRASMPVEDLVEAPVEAGAANQVAVVEEAVPQLEQVPVETTERVVAESLEQSTMGRREFASDVAAPAAPPPPAVASGQLGQIRQIPSESQPVAVVAEAAEMRLRNDAAARVQAVSALGGAPPRNPSWTQESIEAVNIEGAPLTLLSGYSSTLGESAKDPNVSVRNVSGRIISGFDLTWIVGDSDVQARAVVSQRELAMNAEAVQITGSDKTWLRPMSLPRGMRIFVSSVQFSDGTSWTPTAAQLARQRLAVPAIGAQKMFEVVQRPFGPRRQ